VQLIAEYNMKVEDVKFDTTISQFNRLQDEQEYNKTLLSIKELGQIEPIYMDGGYCIDGRHRTRAMRELGICTIVAIDVNPKLSLEDKIAISNVDLTSGRDLTKTQLAIQAYKYAELTGVSKVNTATKFGVNKKMLTYAGEVKQYMPEAYQELIDTGKAELDGKYTQSLERLYKHINANIKPTVEVEDKGLHTVNYDRLINTEQGKELFWILYNENRRPDPELAEHLVKYVNLRYVAKA